MARHTPTQNPQSHTHRAPSQTQQAVDATQQAIIDNLQKKVEQAEAKLHEVEQRAAETQAALDKQIAEKKAQLAAMNTASEPASQSVAVAPAPQPAHTSKKGKIDWNPLNRVRHIGTRALSGVVGFPSRVAAKVNHIVARPQQLVSGGFRKDLGKNILKTPGAILTTLSGAVYRPHRDKVKFEDNFKDYGPTF